MISGKRALEILELPSKIFEFESDFMFEAISLLRRKIPYEECKSIIEGGEHDEIYFCDFDVAIRFLDEQDFVFLSERGVLHDEDTDSLMMFV